MDYVSATNDYLGGSISPGVRMRLRAMNEFTARLPLVDWQDADMLNNLGTTTEKALLAGGVLGLVAEINGMFHRLIAQGLPVDHLILTGGDAPLLSQYLGLEHTVEPQLLLIGLNKILRLYTDELH